MLSYNELKPKTYIVFNGDPWEVVSVHVFRKQQRKPVNQTKIRNLKTGKVIDQTFHQSEKVEPADIETRTLTYIYNNRGEWWFHEAENPSARMSIPEDTLGENRKFLKEQTDVDVLFFESEPIGIHVPIKMQLKVTEAPPNVKGNTATGGTKPVTLETGAVVNAPLFIEAGDTIEVNTETGEYTNRVQ